MAIVTNLATGDTITETWVDSVKDGLNTGVLYATVTPTLTGMAVGTTGAVNVANYKYVGGMLHMNGIITFGSSGATLPGASALLIDLPTGFTSSATSNFNPCGICTMVIAGTTYKGVVWQNTTTTMRFLAENAAGTYASVVATSGTIPGTWAAGSSIQYHFSTPATYA